MEKNYYITCKQVYEFKKKKMARQAVQKAINQGQLKRPNSCDLCKKTCKPQAHHTDYGKALKITWLCTKCHGSAHCKLHTLNPNNIRQTPCDVFISGTDSITVAVQVPVKHYLALKMEAEEKKIPIATLTTHIISEKVKLLSDQLEFNFGKAVV